MKQTITIEKLTNGQWFKFMNGGQNYKCVKSGAIVGRQVEITYVVEGRENKTWTELFDTNKVVYTESI